jgi:single-strand DNA-binding protein
VNLVGRVHNTQYQDSEGREVYGLEFTVEEIDYLDSKAEGEDRRSRRSSNQGAQQPVTA